MSLPAIQIDQINQLRGALKDLLELCESADALDLMPNMERYKAEAVLEDVTYRARKALRDTQ